MHAALRHGSWIDRPAVLNFFMAGPEYVSWDLTALGPRGTGPFRLVIHHAAGSISEHFDTVTSALLRQGQLESLLMEARDASPSTTLTHAADIKNDAAARRGHSILVIDDDQTVTETFAAALHREGFNVRTAANAEAALREIASTRTDAIIVDLRMPMINGLGFLYRLRTWDEHRHTPVAIVTGAVVDDTMQAELSELGAELRFKPLWLEDVVELAHQLVGRVA
jgi:CheY-like chemotaxis protein